MKFYINSINGVYVYDYLGHKSYTEYHTGNTVLFPSGSEFLVCKVTEEEDPLEKGKMLTAIYLRNVCLGMSKNQTFLWTDNNIGSS